MGIAILNKLSGLYGILSIFTGHPLDLVQWLLYITSILIVPCYAIGFRHIQKPKILEFAPILVLYTIDSLTSLGFIVWFLAEWLINEDVKIEKIEGEDYSKSASQGYEYGWIFLTTIGINVSRVYFNLILLSFYKKLIRFNKLQGIETLQNGEELDLKNQYFWVRWNYKFQKFSYNFLKNKI